MQDPASQPTTTPLHIQLGGESKRCDNDESAISLATTFPTTHGANERRYKCTRPFQWRCWTEGHGSCVKHVLPNQPQRYGRKSRTCLC